MRLLNRFRCMHPDAMYPFLQGSVFFLERMRDGCYTYCENNTAIKEFTMRSPIRKRCIRILSAAFIMLLLLHLVPVFSAADARKFSYSDAQDARLRALDCLMTCAFSQEWSASGAANAASTLHRWEKTIKICVTGKPSSDDLNQLKAFIMEVAVHCPNMPNIRIVNNEAAANIVLYYGP